MGIILRLITRIANMAQSAWQFYARISPRAKLRFAIALGAIGLLTFVIGISNTIDATNKYNDLDTIPPPDPAALQQMSQADLMVVAQVGMAKRDLLVRRAQASAVIGAGAALLGLATLIIVRLPEQSLPATSVAPPPAANTVSAAVNSAEADTNAR